MRSLRLCLFGFFFVGLLGFLVPLSAQQGTLTGIAMDVETGQPIVNVQISVQGMGQATGGLSNDTGRYTLQLQAGTYTIVAQFLGYVTSTYEDVEITAGGTTALDIRLTSTRVALDPIVVTASRGQGERNLDAPATTFSVGAIEIQERSVQTPVDHLRTAPGVDIITEGIQSTNVVVRGFNNIFSGALHALTDHRLAGVPSLRVNLLHFIPSNNEDIDRMEVVLGPGSALYGPNTANGVLHILTRSPLDSASEGTIVSLGGGERSVFQGSFRSAYLVNRRLGVKLSGQYLRGNEWEYTDLGESAARQAAVDNPSDCQTKLVQRGYGMPIAALGCTRVGQRDFDLERYGLEARADYQFSEDGTVILTYGRTSASGIELTGLGAGQTEDWIYQFFQARMNTGRFFAQAYYNTSDAGNSWLLRDGVPLVDQSKLFVAQAQHGLSILDGRQDFTYGVDLFRTRPDTKGTINGVYEDEDDIDEWGAYLQSKTELSPMLDLILAARVDDHSMLPERVWSPRAAIVFKPNDDNSLRFTYNRAFSTPSTLNLFLDISAGAAPNEQLAALGYTVRAHGTGSDGYSFQNPDGSLKGMRSPFAPGFLPADPSVMWQLAMGVLQAQVASGGLPAELAGLLPVLGSLSPTSSDIGVMLLNASSGIISPAETTTIPAVPGMRESYTETFEVGWQGILGQKLGISADVYFT
ncbi:MAG: TonB-dependent receptor, partial [Gemmatimonadetes bacterium]|nr:TonB-dependent receptor [Gemmatimonadota bacterium]